jgi:hypothetical protein
MSQEQTVFILSDHALNAVVQKITDVQWDLPATTIPHAPDETPTVRELINRHVYDDAWVPDTLHGKTITEVGNKYDGDLLGDDPKASFAAAVTKAVAAVEALSEANLDSTVHLTYGDYVAREYLQHITTYRGFRAYGLAKFLHLDTTMPDALIDGLWDIVVPNIDSWRAMGVFGPAVDVPTNADKQTKLLGLTGFLQV